MNEQCYFELSIYFYLRNTNAKKLRTKIKETNHQCYSEHENVTLNDKLNYENLNEI